MVKKVKASKRKKLTLKQQKFVKEYLESGNGTEAAIKAGYSKNSAQEIASENLSKPIIQQSVASAAEKLGITPEYVLGNFKEIADFNKQRIKKYIGKGEDIQEVEEMRDAAISLKANEGLGKHLKLFTDTVEVTGKDGKDLMPDAELKNNLAKKIALILASAAAE